MFWDKKGIPRNPIRAIFTLVFSFMSLNIASFDFFNVPKLELWQKKSLWSTSGGKAKKCRIFDHVVYGQSLSLCVCMCAAAALKLPRVIQSRMRGQKKKIEDLL